MLRFVRTTTVVVRVVVINREESGMIVASRGLLWHGCATTIQKLRPPQDYSTVASRLTKTALRWKRTTPLRLITTCQDTVKPSSHIHEAFITHKFLDRAIPFLYHESACTSGSKCLKRISFISRYGAIVSHFCQRGHLFWLALYIILFCQYSMWSNFIICIFTSISLNNVSLHSFIYFCCLAMNVQR